MADPIVTARSVTTGVGPRGVFPTISVDVKILATDTAAAVVTIPLRTNYKIVLTRVVFSVTTDAAQSVTLQDDATTPIVLFKSKSSPGLGVIDAQLGEDGIAQATVSKNVTLTLSAAGLAGQLHIEGYYLPVGPFVPSGL